MKTPMNPLEAIDNARRDLQIAAEYKAMPLAAESAADLFKALAAVVELVEADLALDAANRALATTSPQSEDAETMSAMRAHRDQCRARRATALARFGEQKDGG